MQEISCIFCNTRSEDVYVEENGYFGRRCPACHLIYISPRPEPEEVAGLYDDDREHAKFAANLHEQRPIRRFYARERFRYLLRHIQQGSLLEIGSGYGDFIEMAHRHGFQARGLELNPVLAEYINDYLKIPCERKMLKEGIYADGSFDVIYHCDVISHLYDPVETLGIMNQLLVERGLMVFETGLFGDIPTRAFRHLMMLNYPQHLFFFSMNSIERLLAATGFELVTMYRFNITPATALAKWVTSTLVKMKSDKTTSADEAVEAAESTVSGRSLRAWLLRDYQYLLFWLFYRLGRVLPKKRKLTSNIFVIRKVKNYR